VTRSPRSGVTHVATPDRSGGTDHWGNRRDDRGIAAVEFALLAPMLMTLLVGIVIAGTAALGQLKVQSAARDGARAASVEPGIGCTVALDRLAGTEHSTGTSSCSTVSVCPGTVSTIAVTSTQTVTITIIGSRTITLDADATFECQS
jgi:Flp pilus assembly protein TadG